MKIFCTGASGYIGGSVAAHLIAAGHQVTGLVRSPEKAEAVRARGIQPLLGTLDDGQILAQAAQAADIVVNAASADHRGAVESLLGALAGCEMGLKLAGVRLAASGVQAAMEHFASHATRSGLAQAA